MSEQIHEHQQSLFAALADPMRRSLLVNLAEHSPKTATQLAEEYPVTRQGILKHLTILEHAGLVAIHQVGREKRYTLTPEPLEELEQWIEDLGAKWDERLLRLKTWLENEQTDT
ncbi:MAG TPA: metalloregulator ArsR/SmtB family transcription factor [Anaerolineales bacterium]|nr:metalloregulator ArsR/SmtB family transcription factor [Anaerolineales bacterium]